MRKNGKSKKLPRYRTIEKILGETPLQAAERLRKKFKFDDTIPLAYAGRLDPMASGKLLILIGDECKKQINYHQLDKTYSVEIILGLSSDTGDVLGLLNLDGQKIITEAEVIDVLEKLPGEVSLPYPHFSSKTVKGKPLHTWTLEGRIGEIEIPVKKSHIHKVVFQGLRSVSKDEILHVATTKIESIPKVTEESKKLGADFRRADVRNAWGMFDSQGGSIYQVLTLECTASSGTYMRSLAGYIAKKLGTTGLAYSIHRKKIGKYIKFSNNLGFWLKSY